MEETLPDSAPGLRVAYFVNQYPKVSHSFIRREIHALEKLGVLVTRIALRGWDADVVDREDKQEQSATRYVLKDKGRLLSALLRQGFTSPLRFLRAVGLALSMSRAADRPWPLHLVYLAEACRILPWLRESGVHHVHAHFGTNSAEVVMLAKVLGGPGYSFTVHGPEEFDKPQFLRLADKIERAAFVVAISSYGRSQLFRWIGYEHWSKVKVVHCGVDPAFHEVPEVPLPEKTQLVCVGRLCEQKGQLLLVEAARRLVEQNLRFRLVLAGDGELRQEIELLIERYGLTDFVEITGWVSSDQVRELLQASRALVLPSFAEGLPVVIMEAMALRRPVLSTYVAGIPELVVPGENGWLFPAGSVDHLVGAMAEVLAASTDTLEMMGAAAHQRVLERHDIDREASKLAGHFKESTR